MASGHHHLQNEATEPSETGLQAAQRFLHQLASIPLNSEVVPSSSPFYNTNNFIALHAVCGNPDGEDSSQRPENDDDAAAAAAADDDRGGGDDDNFDSDPSYGFSDLPHQSHCTYNSGSSDEFRMNDNPNCAQLDAGEGVMGCTGAELCTSGRYDQGPSTLPDGAEYCMTGGREGQTELTVPPRLAEEHEEQQSPNLNCGEYFQLQTVSSGYMTGTPNAGTQRDRQNRFHPILDAFLESLQTDRKKNQQTVGQQDQDPEDQPAGASASESPAPPCSHTPASALAAVVAAVNHSDEEQDKENEDASSVESREDDDNTD